MDKEQFQDKAVQTAEAKPKSIGSLLKEIISADRCEYCRIRLKDTGKYCRRCGAVLSRRLFGVKNPERVAKRLIELVGEKYMHAEITHIELEHRGSLASAGNRDIFIWGDIGVGKTHCIAAMVKQYLCQGYECRRINFDKFCSLVRSTMNTNSKLTEYELVKQMTEVDKLFIDDVGLRSRQESEFAYITFYSIIDKRIEKCLQTIIATNKSIEQITKSFDSRIASRLSMAVNIHMVGLDRRIQQTKGGE